MRKFYADVGIILAIVGVAGLVVFAPLITSWLTFDGDSGEPALPSTNCYFVTDSLGHEFASEDPTFLGDIGVYWKTAEGWGVVTNAVNMRVDRDCLRRRGVEVD